MSLSFTSLNSGSNANCYYIGNEQEAILVDAGLSCRETEYRMNALGLSMQKVKAVFISHEHSDHIRGVERLAAKYRLPVMITERTCTNGNLRLSPEQKITFYAMEPVQVGELSVTAFPKFHDAADPHSFIISYRSVNVGVFTDIGRPCEKIAEYFNKCHAAFLESNYDATMLETGRYPAYLKNRIRGGNGHLSNTQALEIFKRHRPSFMSHLVLSHLSRENNSALLVQQLFDAHAGKTRIIVASRERATPVFTIQTPGKIPGPHGKKMDKACLPSQLRLFQ